MNNPYKANKSLRKEAIWIVSFIIATGFIMLIAGWQDGIEKAQKHIQFCNENPHDNICK